MKRSAIILGPEDDVAVALRDLSVGETCEIDDRQFACVGQVPIGHKIALRDIAAGERIRKCGVPIGSATRNIARGEHVHVHNVRSDWLTNYTDREEDRTDDGAARAGSVPAT